jgi:hypothetical protein
MTRALTRSIEAPAVIRPPADRLRGATTSPTSGWFAQDADPEALARYGFGLGIGSTHLARTIMLADLCRVMDTPPEEAEQAILERNILHKRTGSGRRLALRHLRSLYGFGAPTPILWAMTALWARAGDGLSIIALLAALAREGLLRESCQLVLSAPIGASVQATDFAALFERYHPGRYTAKTLASLSRNCASSWTQSGHLSGKLSKARARPAVSPAAAAFAALLGSLAGFGGPALLASPWVAVLDRSRAGVLSLLKRAEGEGLLRLRAAGGIVDIEVRRHMAAALEVPELADDR